MNFDSHLFAQDPNLDNRVDVIKGSKYKSAVLNTSCKVPYFFFSLVRKAAAIMLGRIAKNAVKISTRNISTNGTNQSALALGVNFDISDDQREVGIVNSF